MTRLGWIFSSIAAIDAVLLLVMLVMTLQSSSGHNDGGREMALFFLIIVPAAVLGLASLMFWFGSLPVKVIALLIVLVPGFWFAKVQIQDRIVDRQIAADRSGAGYFHTEPMRQMGAAVVQRDVETLRRVGPTVDVNTPGREMTLLRLAVDGPDARRSDGSELPVVRDPLPVQLAIYRRWDLLTIAIELGADTGRTRPDGRSVAGELSLQIDEEKAAEREVPVDLLRARAALDARQGKR